MKVALKVGTLQRWTEFVLYSLLLVQETYTFISMIGSVVFVANPSIDNLSTSNSVTSLS